VHVGLDTKPSGCVVWTRFDRNTIALGPFRFFGAEARAIAVALGFRIAMHTKENAEDIKKNV
jgi:hypothetical protein